MPPTEMKIDFVSDVVCPWCAIGLNGLTQALQEVAGEISATIHFQPFELNPQMPPEGQDVAEHLQKKYGSTPEQSEKTREMIRQRGQSVGFTFRMDRRSRIYNTFDCHRLLHWSEGQGRQLELKRALMTAYFTDGLNLADRDTLVSVADSVGLDPVRAAQILASDEFAADVRRAERFYLDQGIHAVPAVIINDRHLIEGGQPAAVFKAALLEIAQSDAGATIE